MAEKKLTNEQVKELARALRDTEANVYEEAERLFEVEATEDVFGQLAAQEQLFCCDECGHWLPTSEIEASLAPGTETCRQCASEMNDDGEDGEA